MIPSAREERRGARRLSLIVLSTLAATGVEASRGGAIAAEASISTLSAAQAAGALTMTMKKMAAMVSLYVLLCGLGFLGGSFTRPRTPSRSPAPATSGSVGG